MARRKQANITKKSGKAKSAAKIGKNEEKATKIASDLAQKETVADLQEDDYVEEEDEDFDLSQEAREANSSSDDDDGENSEPEPDYSSINNNDVQERLVKTRYQRLQEANQTKEQAKHRMMHDDFKTTVDIDALFSDMRNMSDLRQRSETPLEDDVKTALSNSNSAKSQPKNEPKSGLEPQTIKIRTSYVFAGKLVNEEKEIDINSAEAKAYLNSTKLSSYTEDASVQKSTSIPVIRKVGDENRELQIKLKRPSLIDKLLMSASGKSKLSTLEKSRLDWASYVDRNKIKDDLNTHNKGGYLDKQDFLSRVEMKRNIQYREAKDKEKRLMMNHNN